MNIKWNMEKNKHLIKTGNISFEIVEEIINEGSAIIEPHPKKEKYANQIVILFKHKDYWWVCPAVELKDGFFLKTIFPSRKIKKEMENEHTKK